MPLDPDRRALLDRIVAEGDHRRRTRLIGGGAGLVMVIGLVAALLTVVGDQDKDRQLLTADGGVSATTSATTVAPPVTVDDPSTSTSVPDGVPGDSPTTTVVPTSTVGPPPASVPGSWSALPPSGVTPRFGGVRAWTGRELLAWGGETGFTDTICEEGCSPPPVFDGVVFDPAANTWRAMAPSPLRVLAGGAWTGSELIVVAAGTAPAAAAYDPGLNTWRMLPTGPVAEGWTPAVVALGGEVYVVRNGAPHGAGPKAAVFAPSTGTWRVIGDPPANEGLLASGVVGGEVVVAFYRADGLGVVVAAVSPGGAWRVVGQTTHPTSYSTAAVVAGGRLWVAACSYVESGIGVTVESIDVGTGAVVAHPVPSGDCPQLVAAGSRVVSLTPLPDEYQPESIRVQELVGDAWREVSSPPAVRIGAPTWTGSEILFWGGCACGGLAGSAVEGGYRLRL